MKEYSFPRRTRLLVSSGDTVEQGDPLDEGSLSPADLLALHTKAGRGSTPTELYLVGEVQKVYKSQGVDIHDKHIELIVRQMMKKVRVETPGDTELLPGQLADKVVLERANEAARVAKGEKATFEPLILGITKASLATESFLSAASFQETTKVLTDAAIEGKVDRLLGLKENVIIGKLIPAATGLRKYRGIDIEPSEPLPAAMFGPGSEAELLAALEEIGDGDGLDLSALGLGYEDELPSCPSCPRRRTRARTRRSHGGGGPNGPPPTCAFVSRPPVRRLARSVSSPRLDRSRVTSATASSPGSSSTAFPVAPHAAWIRAMTPSASARPAPGTTSATAREPTS